MKIIMICLLIDVVFLSYIITQVYHDNTMEDWPI